MTLHNPGMLWLLLVLVPVIAWYIWKHRGADPTLGVSTLLPVAKLPVSWKVWMMQHRNRKKRYICQNGNRTEKHYQVKP